MMNDVIQPASKIINSSGVKLNPKPSSFSKLAPNITGIDMKNENSAATDLEVPIRIAPIIVEPDLEVPGTKDKIWKSPTMKASRKLNDSQSVKAVSLFWFQRSIRMKSTPYTTRATATVCQL